MKIINIVPGFGGTFYCGNCLRDSGFVKSLKATGHEAVTLPMYLPLSVKENFEDNDIPVFYGAVNIFLKQKFSFLRHMPAWMHRFFDSPFILRFAASKAGSTRADGLEEMTISMLQGSDGFQDEELQELINFLKFHEKPDVVHLSNALLIGMAKKIKEELQIPVVCSLQDEDVWVDVMRPGYREKVWNLMSEKAKDVDAFVAVSKYFATVMKEKMKIPDEKIHIVHIGVDPDAYEVHIPAHNPPVITYLSRMNEENGFEILIDAFIKLKDEGTFKNARLKVTGGKTDDDNKFIAKQKKKLSRKNYLNDVEFIEDFRTTELGEFFKGTSLLSVPVLNGEAFGLYQLEAMASGIPIVQPALGAFPEVVELSGGGAIYHRNTPDELAKKWQELLSEHKKIQQMSINGRNAVLHHFNTHRLTEKMVLIYENVMQNQKKKTLVS